METLNSEDFALDNKLDLGAVDQGRRIFIQGVGFVGAGLLLGVLGGCETLAEAIRNRPVRRRLRGGSPEVDEAIALYAQAVAAMKGLPASDPRSWTAQAAIHGTSAGFQFCEHGTDYFFDWHRAYLFYFEKICQKLTGNAKFGLPYWNWNKNVDIPVAFQDTSSPLFLARTRNSMSGSSSITNATLNTIFADSNFFTFGQQLEGTPHNTVHTFIGGTLGSSSAALDPLFFAHHCMIDYCWYKWNVDMNNDNPNTSTWINRDHAHFVDADGNAAHVTAGVTTLMPLLSYQYEASAIGGFDLTADLRTKKAYQLIERRIRDGADVRFDIRERLPLLERASMRVNAPLSVPARGAAASFSRIINADAASERVFARIEYAQLPAANDFAVRVFVNLPAAVRNTSLDDPHYAGSFAFFGTQQEGGGHEGHHAGGKHQPRFLVDLTATLQKLKRMQALREGTPLTLQLVAVPFPGSTIRDDVELALTTLELIVTPVLVRTGTR